MGHIGSALAGGIAIFCGSGVFVSLLAGMLGSLLAMAVGGWVYEKVVKFFGGDIKKLDYKVDQIDTDEY